MKSPRKEKRNKSKKASEGTRNRKPDSGGGVNPSGDEKSQTNDDDETSSQEPHPEEDVDGNSHEKSTSQEQRVVIREKDYGLLESLAKRFKKYRHGRLEQLQTNYLPKPFDVHHVKFSKDRHPDWDRSPFINSIGERHVPDYVINVCKAMP